MKNKKLLIGIIIFITLVNLGSLGAILYYTYYDKDDQPPFRTDREREDFRDRRDKYKPNPEARQFFNEARDTFRERVHPNVMKIRKNQSEMMEELLKESPNQQKLDSLAEASGDIHAIIRKNMAEVFMQMSEKASPEQLKHLERFYRHVMIDDKGPKSRHKQRRHRNNH